MSYEYKGKKEGNFYGVLVKPGESYDFKGELERLAKKTRDFKKTAYTKKTNKKEVEEYGNT